MPSISGSYGDLARYPARLGIAGSFDRRRGTISVYGMARGEGLDLSFHRRFCRGWAVGWARHGHFSGWTATDIWCRWSLNFSRPSPNSLGQVSERYGREIQTHDIRSASVRQHQLSQARKYRQIPSNRKGVAGNAPIEARPIAWTIDPAVFHQATGLPPGTQLPLGARLLRVTRH